MILLGFITLVLVTHVLLNAARPAPAPRSVCDDCGASFLNQRGVTLHRMASHPNTFDMELL